MKLTIEEYFGKWFAHEDATEERKKAASEFLIKLNALMDVMTGAGFVFKINPLTGSFVGGETLGGFRPQSCPIGSSKSSHKEGRGCDLYDPDNSIDAWLVAHSNEINASGLWFEHPQATNTWSHWTDRPPKSGRRFFMP